MRDDDFVSREEQADLGRRYGSDAASLVRALASARSLRGYLERAEGWILTGPMGVVGLASGAHERELAAAIEAMREVVHGTRPDLDRHEVERRERLQIATVLRAIDGAAHPSGAGLTADELAGQAIEHVRFEHHQLAELMQARRDLVAAAIRSWADSAARGHRGGRGHQRWPAVQALLAAVELERTTDALKRIWRK